KQKQPAFTGEKTVSAPSSVLRRAIDWKTFFMTCSLAGTYPRIREDDVVGDEARRPRPAPNAPLGAPAKPGTLPPRGVARPSPA
ncbi:hypothetical protein F9883_18910, partial [Morganella morganii]|uniref:vitamin B12 dependent-methionine synthase activation domain-containing protein n=1 Tax=Morganella morganii TaxID=582 RepID=UPI0015F785C6